MGGARNTFITITALMFCLLIMVYWLNDSKPIAKPGSKEITATYPAAQYPIEKQLSLSFTLKNTSNQLIKNSNFWVYAPVEQTASQQVTALKSSHPHKVITDKFHNQVLHFKIDDLTPYNQKTITINAQLNLSEIPNQQALETPDIWLQATAFVMPESPEVTQLAKQLKHHNKHQTAKNIYQWSVDNIRYSGSNSRESSAVETLRKKQGDCTDYMHLFASLGRKNQLPTREVGGYIVAQNKIIHHSDFHNWAEYYHHESWHLVDPQNNNFHEQYQNYIAFRHYGDDPGNPLNNTHRYKISDPRIHVEMN